MGRNPVEDNFVTRFILGFAVISVMSIVGGAVGQAFITAGIPYGDWIGVGAGTVLVFAVFVILYRRYDDSYDLE